MSQAHGWEDPARSTLGRVLTLLPEGDARLQSQDTRAATCVAIPGCRHGIFYCKATVELRDFFDNSLISSHEAKKGFLYLGSHKAMQATLDDAAATIREAIAHPEIR